MECRSDTFLICRFRWKVEIISTFPLRTNVAFFLNESFLCIYVNKVSHYNMVIHSPQYNLKVKWLRTSTWTSMKYQKSFYLNCTKWPKYHFATQWTTLIFWVYVSPQNTIANSSGEFRLDDALSVLSKSSSNSTFDSGDNEATIGTSLQCRLKVFDRETFLTELRKFPSIWCRKYPD